MTLSPDVRAVLDGVRLVAWDFDGTLVDTEPRHEEAFRRHLRELGVEPAPDFFAALVGHSETENWARLARQHGLDVPFAELARRRQEIYRDVSSGLRANAFVADVLAATPDAVHVVTSAAHWENVGHILERLDVADRFAVAWAQGAPDDTATDKRGRLERALATYGTPAVLIDDAAHWLEVGRELGMRTLWARHGYNGGRAVPSLEVG